MCSGGKEDVEPEQESLNILTERIFLVMFSFDLILVVSVHVASYVGLKCVNVLT